MAKATLDSGRLKLHVDSRGRVCAALGDTLPKMYGSLEEVWRRLGPAPDVFILAAPCNASVIREIYGWQRRERGHVWLASPGIIKDDPVAASAVLKFRRLNELPASLGGWHMMTDTDAVIYDLRHALLQQAPESQITARLQEHPAWRLWSFIPHLHLPAFAHFLTLVGDPRWYVDPRNPLRDSRLQLYLGLVPRIASRQSGTGRTARYQATLVAWGGDALEGQTDPEDPRQFLYRRYRERLDNPTIARLRASQHFVRFVRHVWLAAQSPAATEMLAPDCVFWKEDEIEAFKQHIKSVR